MRKPVIPLEIGVIHIIGIGGIGMSGIAEVLAYWGYKVQGSDAKDGPNLERLRGEGVKVFVGHSPENIDDAGIVLISSAVKSDNVEVMAAREKGLPVVRRSEMLAELMRLGWTVAVGGTHGKTTTTSMVATLLDAAGKDPTVINGGIINAYGTNARVGTGDWMVVEADESDGTFTKLRPNVAIVTNMDPEHLDFYGTKENMEAAFEQFVESVPFYGFSVLCIDHPAVQSMVAKVTDRKIFTYGFNPQADVQALNPRLETDGSHYDVHFKAKFGREEHFLKNLHLPMAGLHNVQNSLAAICVASELGASEEQIRNGLDKFMGVKRRFSLAGEFNGVKIIDDYGHHPVEIKAVLAAARQVTKGKVIAVIQPHRYTRLHDLFEEFCRCLNDADVVAIADVYAAGEKPINGVNSDVLVQGLKDHGHKNASKLNSPDDLPQFFLDNAKPGDIFVCLGAGDISNWANSLEGKLKALKAK